MRRILQRKFMLVFWLAMVVNSLSMVVATTVYPLKTEDGKTIGEVSFTIAESSNGNRIVYTTTYNIKWQRGLNVSSVVDQNSNGVGILSSLSPDENYSYAQSVKEDYYGIEGDYIAKNVSVNPTVTSPIELKNIFNYYTPNSAQISGDEIVISSDVSGPSGAMKLDFQNTNSMTISIQKDKHISTYYYEFEINGGILNFTVNGTGDHSNYLPDITLNSGDLTLQGEVAGVQNLVMTGGTFTLDGMGGKAAKIDHLEASGGTILVKNNKSRDFFTDLTINGDVSIKGENIYDSQNICEGSDGYIGNTVIKSGTVSIEKVSLGTWNLIEIENGDVTLKDVIFNYSSISPSSQTASSNILLKSGKLQLDNCHLALAQGYFGDYVVEVENGDLSINGGIYSGGKKAILGLTGANAKTTIKNGIFQIAYLSQQGDIVYLQDGELNIEDGVFQDAPIVAEKGALSIKGGTFCNESFIQATSEKDFNLYVKGDGVNVKLSGGNYSEASVYIDPSVNMQPKDLLENDYEYYTEYNGYYQEEVTQFVQNQQIGGLSGKYLSFGEVRKDKIADNPCLEIAQKADVGPNGTDVKTIETRESPYGRSIMYVSYEIKTPAGLLWYAASVTAPEVLSNSYNFPLDNELLKEGKAAVKIVADLDMSGYDWVPFWLGYDILLDGQGHVISNLSVNQSNNATFISSNEGMLANLVLKNSTFSLKHKHSFLKSSSLEIGSLASSNNGTIVNCGVQQSSIIAEVYSESGISIGGLVGSNFGKIYNSYVTGDVKCTIKHLIDSIYSCSSVYIGVFDIGGLAGSSRGVLSNCYHVGKVECVKPELYSQYMQVHVGDFVGHDYTSNGVVENCYTNPELQTLNSNVISHSHSVGEMEWSKWITESDVNMGYPIHGYNNESIYMGASVIESEFTLLKEGNGEFKATYTYLEDETEKTGTIYADTTYTVINQEQFKITATPAEGSELVKVVHIQNGRETELPDIQPGVEFAYNIVVADTLKAYFKEKEIIVIPDELDLSQIQVDTVTVTYENNNWYYQETGKEKVAFTGEVTGTNRTVVLLAEDIPANAPALQFVEGSSVSSLVVSGESPLQVEGSVTVGSVSGNITASETTTITPPEDVTPVETPDKVQSGGSYEVTAFGGQIVADNTQLPAGTVLSFEITIQEGYELASATIGGNQLVESLSLLRTRAVSTTVNRYYEITGKETDLTVEITFRKTDTDEPEDPDTPSVDPVKYYNIYKESICDGVSVSFSKNPVKEGGSISIYVEKDEENYTFENFKVYYKDGYYGNWKELEESTQPGEYKIQNIWNHIYVKAEGSAKKNPTGMEEIEGVKVYTKDGSLFVQTPQREQVIVISMTGAVVKSEEQIGLKQYHGLNPGIYIVRIGEQVFKVRLK